MSYKVYDENCNELHLEELDFLKLKVSGGMICRGMLYSINENGLSNDLIYTTPTNYPIEGIESKIEVSSDFVISEHVYLEELLKYLKYGVDLTQSDLDQIYRRFISHNWWLKHYMELFGWKKVGVGYNYSYDGNQSQVIPMFIYNNLDRISCYANGIPHVQEPNHTLIRRRKK